MFKKVFKLDYVKVLLISIIITFANAELLKN